MYSTSIMQEATHSNYLLDGLRTLWGPKAGCLLVLDCILPLHLDEFPPLLITLHLQRKRKSCKSDWRARNTCTHKRQIRARARAPHTDGCWGVAGVIGDLVLMRSFGQLRRDDARPFLAPIQPLLWATNKRRQSYAAAIRAAQQSAVRATRFGPSPRAPSRQRLPSPSRA